MSAGAAPVFVVGPARSGTTLTAAVLGRHSRIFAAAETHFLEDVWLRRGELGEPSTPAARERILERLQGIYGRYGFHEAQERLDRLLTPEARAALLAASGWAELYDRFMTLQAAAAGKVRWCNHVPRDAFHLETLRRWFPAARVVFCVRDLRACLHSYRNKWRATTPEHVERLRRIYHPAITSLLWTSTLRQLAAARSWPAAERPMALRYERLVARPEEVVDELCRHLGEAAEPGLIEVASHNSSFDAPQGRIFAASVGRWRGELAPEEVWIAQRIGRRELAEHGYELEPARPRPLRLAAELMRLPLALPRALRANRRLRGPLLPYLAKRLGTLLRRPARRDRRRPG